MRVLGTITAVLFLFLLLPPSASGQVALGFQGGPTLATIGGSDAGDDFGYRAGIAIGALLDIPVSGILSIQPEVSFFQKGAESTEEGVDVKFKLDYIEVPLFLKINVPTEGTNTPFLMVGPAVGFKVGCSISGEDGGVSVDLDCDEAEIELSSIDFGGVVGAGVGFELGPGQFLLSARYSIGFMTIDDSSDEDDIKNRAFSFLAGYSFPLGG